MAVKNQSTIHSSSGRHDATHIEYDQWMRKDEETNDELVERLSTITKNKESSPKPKQEKKDYKQVFDDLFGDTE